MRLFHPPAHPRLQADPEACERRGWAQGHRLLTGLLIGALLAALMNNEALALDLPPASATQAPGHTASAP